MRCAGPVRILGVAWYNVVRLIERVFTRGMGAGAQEVAKP